MPDFRGSKTRENGRIIEADGTKLVGESTVHCTGNSDISIYRNFRFDTLHPTQMCNHLVQPVRTYDMVWYGMVSSNMYVCSSPSTAWENGISILENMETNRSFSISNTCVLPGMIWYDTLMIPKISIYIYAYYLRPSFSFSPPTNNIHDTLQ